MTSFFYQIHGYKNGHQLLSQNIQLNRVDQDAVDRLSDISGPLKPDESFESYLTCYPLPSKEYFVIAKTWQDLTVSRAGCVVTKSLILPMTEWSSTKEVSSLFQMVIRANPNKEIAFDNHLLDSPMKVVLQIPADELVEAIFLEKRQPILVFNCPYAEHILIRIYSVMWASLRTNFSSSSWALSQRSIGGEPFDLLFAPVSAKSKFSEWPGKRIDASSGLNKSARHRWTSDLAESIFMSSTPSLFSLENNNFFINGDANESTLRLTLLWNELLIKAETESSPLAILGLLDIINSQPVFATELYKNLQPYIYNAIQLAAKKLPELDAWKFYAALLVKHKRKLMDREMLALIRKYCADLAESNVQASIDFIKHYKHPSSTIPSVLYAAIGDGIAEYCSVNSEIDFFEQIPELIFLPIMATSNKFSKAIVINYPASSYSFHDLIERTLQITDVKQVSKAKKNLSQFIDNESQLPLFKNILKGIDVLLFKIIISNVAKNNALVINIFHEIIVFYVNKLNQFDFIIVLIEKFDQNPGVDGLIEQLIEHRPELINWVMANDSISEERKLILVNHIFSELEDDIVAVVHKEKRLSESLIDLMVSNEKEYDVEIYKSIIYIANIPLNNALILLINLPGRITKTNNSKWEISFLIKAFHLIGNQYEDVLIELINKVDRNIIVTLIDILITNHYSQKEALKNIRILLKCNSNVSKILSGHIDQVSLILYNGLQNEIENDLAIAWSQLLKESDRDRKTYSYAATLILDFSYKCVNSDPTELLVAAFPIVYKSFLHNNPIDQIFSFLFSSDWDKCKALRQDLVQRYIKYSWSTFGLFRVAYETGITKEVMTILIDTKGGKSIIRSAIREGLSSQQSSEHPVLIDIDNILKK